MLTKLGKAVLSAALLTTDGSPIKGLASGDSKVIFPFKSTAGTSKYFQVSQPSTTPSLNFITALADDGYGGIAVGSDDTAATDDDYTLASVITTLTGSITTTVIFDSDNNKYIRRFQLTLTNPTAADIVVKEIGRFWRSAGGTTRGSSGNATQSMIDRTILDNPVTVPANGSAVINYDFAFPNGD